MLHFLQIECDWSIDVRRWLSLCLEILSTLLAQVLLQYGCILGVAFVHCIGKISNKWYETNSEVDHDVYEHLHLEIGWEAAINLLSHPDQTPGEHALCGITSTVDILAGSPIVVQRGPYKGTKPMTLLHPNLMPQQLNRLRSSR